MGDGSVIFLSDGVQHSLNSSWPRDWLLAQAQCSCAVLAVLVQGNKR